MNSRVSMQESIPAKVCAITMVRNENFFLRKWVEYYSSQLGRENLYICFDGEDQMIPDYTEGCNIKVFEHITANVIAGDKRRAAILSHEAKRLSKQYDFIIGTDADEFLIVDPNLKIGLKEFLTQSQKYDCISGLGVDVGMNEREEAPLDYNKPILSQRKYGLLYSRYTKPSIITGQFKWGSGFHRVKGKNYHILKGLYLFHFGGCDITLLKDKQQLEELKSSGWGRHLAKRLSTVRKVEDAVTHNRVFNWDNAVKLSRYSQMIFRPIFAWNKPTTFGVKPVIRIPDRFKDLV